MYGLPKIHKPNFDVNFPFRPIFAAYNTASYKLSKFLIPVLAHLTTNQYTVSNSYSFSESIREINSRGLYMCSFDVESLYTNIPLEETINICLNLLFPSDNSTVLGLNRQYFKRLLEHSVLNSIFLFCGELYKQIDGVGMGLPLSSSFANIFLCYNETIWLHDCPIDFKPIMYKRYVDDTFLLFRDPAHADLFLNYLNSKHPNITFTCERESNNTLAFLDVNVSRGDDKFSTDVYRKPTFSGQGISFFSFCPLVFKINALKTLIHRAYHICSNYANLHIELEFLKVFFSNNGFSHTLFNSILNKFLSSRYDPNPVRPNDQAGSQKRYLSFQYFGYQSEKMKLDLRTILSKFLPTVDFNIVLCNKRTIGSLFKFKDAIPTVSRSCVIYKYVCSQCRAEYIGSTIRTLHTRMSEHQGISSRTGHPLSQPPHSSIRLHCEEACSCLPNRANFSIIDSDSNPTSLRIKESLHIHASKPSLNESNSAFPLHILT